MASPHPRIMLADLVAQEPVRRWILATGHDACVFHLDGRGIATLGPAGGLRRSGPPPGRMPDEVAPVLAAIAAAITAPLAPLRLRHASLTLGLREGIDVYLPAGPPAAAQIDEALTAFAWEDARRRAGPGEVQAYLHFKRSNRHPRHGTMRIETWGTSTDDWTEADPASRGASLVAHWVADAWSWLIGFEDLRIDRHVQRPSGHAVMAAINLPAPALPAGLDVSADGGLVIEPISPNAPDERDIDSP